jgi:hypothetical protein
VVKPSAARQAGETGLSVNDFGYPVYTTRTVDVRIVGDGRDSRPAAYAGRLELRPETHTVILDGRPIPVPHPEAFALYRRLFEAGGVRVSASELKDLAGGPSARIDRVLREHLPAELRATVKSSPGSRGGYWIRLSDIFSPN